MSVALEAKRLSKRYAIDGGADVYALRDIDLEVAAGEFVAIMGPSGCGKSTLLHMLGALDEPSEGEVLVEDASITALSASERAQLRSRRIGFVFQMYNLIPSLTAAENIALPAVVSSRSAARYQQRVDELLELIGLADKRDRFPQQLSGGEQQRVAVARALVMSPAVVLADEPTGNLDSKSGEALMRLFHDCHAAGTTIVLVTHDVKVASHAQRLIHMRDGILVEQTQLRSPGDAAPSVSELLDVGQREKR